MADTERGLPTEEEISQLPRWAIVAFAARCARRAQSVFIFAWPDAPEEHKEAVVNAIQAADKVVSPDNAAGAARRARPNARPTVQEGHVQAAHEVARPPPLPGDRFAPLPVRHRSLRPGVVLRARAATPSRGPPGAYPVADQMAAGTGPIAPSIVGGYAKGDYDSHECPQSLGMSFLKPEQLAGGGAPACDDLRFRLMHLIIMQDYPRTRRNLFALGVH